MAHPSKIATCCHCGTRAMLRLDAGHHTLTCGTCGAPLRDLKAMPLAKPATAAVSHQPAPKLRSLPKAAAVKKSKPRKVKKRKSLWRKVASEAFDFVEDIFD
ncbi:hypothetical protein KDD17_08895 [Sulfitobacter albidus]|uniref:Uncharacterized protein n=1 Tax=Sulfitobacter albidus TaxID=2829501 RepID=A0A975JB71_9RHOB|nr:hypothetical protein [Sulfitobacter albidus]QUJ75147.1 hypothetical protein KDD17_08895 [Sulfitobacter albidus]